MTNQVIDNLGLAGQLTNLAHHLQIQQLVPQQQHQVAQVIQHQVGQQQMAQQVTVLQQPIMETVGSQSSQLKSKTNQPKKPRMARQPVSKSPHSCRHVHYKHMSLVGPSGGMGQGPSGGMRQCQSGGMGDSSINL